MAYQPVERDAGKIMYEAALRRGQTIGGAIQNWTNTLYERQQQAQAAALAKAEEDKAFNSKLKAVESLIQTHSDKFKLSGDQLKQFLSVDPNESPKDRYLRIGGFVEGSLKAAELEKTQAETKLKLAQEVAAKQPKGPMGQVMTLDQYRKLPADVDAKAEPLPGQPGMVVVTGFNLRAPAGLKTEDLGDRIGFFDAAGNLVKTEPKGAAPIAGYETVRDVGTAAPVTPPASVSQFMPRPESGPAMLGSFMAPRPATSAGANAAAAMATQAPATPVSRTRMVPIEGGPAAEARKTAEAQAAAGRERKIETSENLIDAIGKIEPLVSAASVGPGSVLSGVPGTPAANVKSLLTQVQALTAFDELRDLKAEKTTLGQVAIKEIELLQNAAAAISQVMSPDLFKTQLSKLKNDTLRTRNRLLQLELDRKRGLQEPSTEYYKLGGQSLDVLNQQAAANYAQEDAMKALQAVGFKPKR
jgi:hypothetical protein